MPFLSIYLSLKGLDTNQVILFFSIYPISILLLEIPMGFFADRTGDLNALRWSRLITVLVIPIFIATESFYIIVLCQILWAAADALSSGADQSYYFRLNKSKNHDFGSFSSKVSSLTWAGVCISFFASYYIYNIDIEYIFYTFLIISLISLLIVLTFEQIPDENNKQDKSNTDVFTSLIQNITNYQLLSLIALSSFVLASLGSAYLLIQPWLDELSLSGASNGVYFGIATIFSIIASLWLSLVRVLEKQIHISLVGILFTLGMILLIFYNTSSVIYFLIAFSLFRFLWGLYTPLIMKSLNEQIIDDDSRASILSIHSTLFNLIQFVILFIIAFIDLSASNALLALSLILIGASPVIAILMYIMVNQRSSSVKPQAVE
jgi:predicted MFS family arabinose efflux permease